MRIASAIARYLMALIFFVFSLNGFVHFLPAPKMDPLAGQFFGVMLASHYMVPVFLIQLIVALLLFANRYVPLALTLIAPVIFNILTFHILMNPAGIVPGLIVTVCWFIVFFSVRQAFTGIFQARVPLTSR